MFILCSKKPLFIVEKENPVKIILPQIPRPVFGIFDCQQTGGGAALAKHHLVKQQTMLRTQILREEADAIERW